MTKTSLAGKTAIVTLPMPTRTSICTARCVVVARNVEEPNKVVLVSPSFAWIERLANVLVVPTATLPSKREMPLTSVTLPSIATPTNH